MFNRNKFISEKHVGEYLDYLEYVPEKTDGKIPLLLYIHGAGSRGNNLSQMQVVGPVKEIENGRKINAVILVPQCHAETWFDLFEVLSEFIETVIKRQDADKDRVYITGSSMGAYTTWQMCISHPDWFAAAVPVCGGGMYWNAARLKDLPVWAFHGALDKTVLPEESMKMVDYINKNGGNAKLTIFPKDTHNSWDSAFSSDELWEWLFKQKRDT